jgi:hypothetical protein
MGSVNIREEEGYLSIFEHDETELCRIRSENCLDFFLLPKREAIACVELWHEISGRVASLIVKDSNPCFDSIRSWQQLLARALDRVEIRTTQAQKEKIPPPLPMSGFVGLSSEDDLLGLAKRVYGEVSDFRSHLADESPIDSTLAQQASVFQRAVAAREHLVAWLAAADYLCIRSLSSLPTSIEGSGQSQVDVFALLPLLDDRCAARRGYRYHLEQQFLSSAVRKKDVASLDNKDYRIVQHKILGMLERRFDQSLKDRITYGAHQSQKSLTKNEGYTAISDRLKDATEEFCNLHDQCVWADHQTKVFLPDAKTELAKYSADIERCIERGTSRSIWTALFKFGKMIIDVTTESLVCGPGQPLKDQCDAFSRAIGTHQGTFETLYRLRNREAHPHRAEQWQDWAAIQNFVARTLGIVWKSKHVPAKARKLFGPNDLELTPLEGNEVKLKLLREACIGLSVLR